MIFSNFSSTKYTFIHHRALSLMLCTLKMSKHYKIKGRLESEYEKVKQNG